MPILGTPAGIVLNVLVQVVWTFVAFKEIQGCASFFTAVQNIHVDTETRLSTFPGAKIVEFELESITSCRRLSVLSLIVVRIGIVCALLVMGSLWLAGTTELPDMLVNAAALTFILETDQALFQTVMPVAIQVFVRNLRPLPKKREATFRGVGLQSFMLVALTIIYLTVMGLVPLATHVDKVDGIKESLCDGFLDFVWGTSATGEVWSATPTQQELSSFQRDAVFELMRGGSPELSRPARTMQHLAFVADAPLAEYGRASACEDILFALPENAATVQALRAQTAPGARECGDLQAHCHVPAQQLLRLVCPEICGCATPAAGLFSVGPESGCPASCRLVRTARALEAPCGPDLGPAADGGWPVLLAALPGALAHAQQLGPEEAEQLGRAAAGLQAAGCSGIAAYERDAGPALALWHPCGGEGEGRFATVRPFCPEACSCAELQGPDCPGRCGA